MADFLTTKRNEIQARLDELAPMIAERDGLQRALDALEGIKAAPAAAARAITTRKSTRKVGRPRKAAARKTATKAAAKAPAAPAKAAAAAKPAAAKATTKKTAAKKATKATPRRKAGRPRGSGQRSKQALELVTKEPGLSAADIARKIGVHPNYAYRILPNLEEQGQVEKKNRKWYPKSA